MYTGCIIWCRVTKICFTGLPGFPKIRSFQTCFSIIHQTSCLKHLGVIHLRLDTQAESMYTSFSRIKSFTPRQVSKFKSNGISIGDTTIKPSNNVRNLGVCFDTQLNVESQIMSVCKSAYHMIYNLRRIRKYFDQESMKTVVHECVTSKLDYCNSLLYGLPDSHIVKLQRVQNTCARLICNIPRFVHVTPILRELHWLHIRQRIVFKILILVYKALNGQAPYYYY